LDFPMVFLVGLRSFETGANQPMVIQGVCRETGVKGDFVVKYRGAPRMSIEASCRELIASFIAMELDLFVPEPAIINVSKEFVESLSGKSGYKDNAPILDNFFRKLTTLNANFWEQLTVLLPEDWKTNQVFEIISTLKGIIVRQDIFHQEIKKALS
jgi:hypothetical protein